MAHILPLLLDAVALVPGILALAILSSIYIYPHPDSLFEPLALVFPLLLSFIIGGLFDKRAVANQGDRRHRLRSIIAFLPFFLGAGYFFLLLIVGALKN